MIDLSGHHVVWPHNHAHADPRGVEQPFGKVIGHPDAAMRCGISRERATVERDARPSEALHVGHVGVVVHVGVVLCFLLKDSEDTRRRLAPLLPARHWRSHDPALASYTVICWSRSEMIAIIGSSTGRDSTNCSFRRLAASVRSFAAIKAAKLANARPARAQSSLLVLGVEDVR